MTIPRDLRQRSEFLTYLTKQSKKWSFRHATLLSVVGFLCYRLLFIPLSYNSSPDATHREAKYNGKRVFTSPEEIPIDLIHSFDAILVLGGGKPKSIDQLPIYVERRCDDAVEVVRRLFDSNRIKTNTNEQQQKQHDQKEQILPILCLSAGTAHMPQLLSADGLPIWESTACAAYILSKSNIVETKGTTTSKKMIPPESIYVETSSYDTIGNAYFARTTHTDQNGWRKLLVTTNQFHMARTEKIFDWIFSIPTTVIPANTGVNELLSYDLYYLESPNVGMTPEAISARKEREASSSNSVEHLSKKYSRSLADVYNFLTRYHALYAANPLVERGRATTADIEEGSVNDAV
eukprot:CAMPEP_0168249790 /NCGR_PEP_ID=MMETSP0141_2-20121125/2193_1 /TAXON_ID=44445 /ORGANISM="Pseudo-nitzschia australis, Strain 10249 10 AB" /LENGTH=348 /DNA_ID=CAMNT_0008185815 /DNA_START=118 /DNA_END=1160 /DNA_ORIENTATION=+